VSNFGHFLTWWDRLFGTYRAWESLPQAKAAALAKEYDSSKKQGAYGKVKIHKSSTLKHALRNPLELKALLSFKLFGLPGVRKDCFEMPGLPADFPREDVEFCGISLNKVSRSFAQVIRQLPPSLALPVCIFYLVLRALDTVEDDMDLDKFDADKVKVPIMVKRRGDKTSALKGALQCKIASLRQFWTLLYPERDFPMYVSLAGFTAGNVGEGDEAVLLNQYDKVIRVFGVLPKVHQEVIEDICRKMGNGMADYIERDLRQGTDDVADYNRYCHIVAGQVGEGLSRQFAASGLESQETSTFLVKDSHIGLGSLCSDMGLFLQKTNIIRDYLEDFVDKRAFWPKSVWGKHVKEGGLGALAEQSNLEDAVTCLNELVTDALSLFPKSLEYLSLIKNQECFTFCAIPQLMAIATLSTLYSNPKVFTGVVKIRKGIAARICFESRTWGGVDHWVRRCLKDMRQKIQHDGEDKFTFTAHTIQLLDDIEAKLNTYTQ